jgi:hypothetical protein
MSSLIDNPKKNKKMSIDISDSNLDFSIDFSRDRLSLYFKNDK